MHKQLISVVTEETRLYLFHGYALSSFNFVLLVIEKDVIENSRVTRLGLNPPLLT